MSSYSARLRARKAPAWVKRAGGVPALIHLDFNNQRAWLRGNKAIASVLACSRASNGYYQNNNGQLTLFGSSALRIGDAGILVELQKTNVVLWNRDLTNAAWTKTNCTTALDQTGPDGVSNSASSLTATAGNGTCLQAITLASSARFQSAFVKRITGSGTVEMTMDNGTTWTAITVTSSWAPVTIPTQTLANPTVGFRIVTSGDAIAVDFVQNENGVVRSSPIATTTVAAIRASDVVTLATDEFKNALITPRFTLWSRAFTRSAFESGPAQFSVRFGSSSNTWGPYVTSGSKPSLFVVSGGSAVVDLPTSNNAPASSSSFKHAVAFAENDGANVHSDGSVVADTVCAVPTMTGTITAWIGNFGGNAEFWDSYINEIAIWDNRISNAEIKRMTA